ncbi:hypothetical protein [Chryseobacterium proteolyticum]|uniref:hypothetical protein n=1 Tax=Chryseobacterium proteolyticum TaxID=118127 RepID=UPI0039832E11
MLTGKAKGLFEKWLNVEELRSDTVDSLKKHEAFYFIIKWLDEIGFVSQITTTYYDGYFFQWLINITHPIRSEYGFETREEALTDLIKNCDEILNRKQLV